MPILTPTEQLKRILVARTDGLGDVIVTLPIAVAIKERLPGSEVAFLVRPEIAPLVRRIVEVDQVLAVSGFRKALHLLRIYRPNAMIFARPEFRLALDAVLARIDVRIGTGYRWYSGLFTRWVYEHRRRGEKHEAEYGVGLLAPLLSGDLPVRMPELAVSEAGERDAEHRRREVGLVEPYIVVHPGGHGSSNIPTTAQFGAAIRGLLESRSELMVAVVAGPGEEQLAGAVVNAAGGAERVRIVDDISLDGLSELLRRASLFLGGSSGPAHLAALVKTPVVAVYPGLPPLWPVRWRPFGEDVSVLTPEPDERFCPECERNHPPENCVKRISPGRVVAACLARLGRADVTDRNGAGATASSTDTPRSAS